MLDSCKNILEVEHLCQNHQECTLYTVQSDCPLIAKSSLGVLHLKVIAKVVPISAGLSPTGIIGVSSTAANA